MRRSASDLTLLQEEAGITAPLEHCGTLFFVVEGTESAFNIDIFRAYEYNGTITEYVLSVCHGSRTYMPCEVFRLICYITYTSRTDEMRPQWFSIQQDMLSRRTPDSDHASDDVLDVKPPEIPLDKMWADDRYWMPFMFARRFFVGRADFTADNKMCRWWFGAVPTS